MYTAAVVPSSIDMDAYGNLDYMKMLRDKLPTEAFKKRYYLVTGICLQIYAYGICSMLAAQAGAAVVIAVEMNRTVKLTEKIFEENHLEDIIKVVYARVEDIELPNCIQKVDIIVSEWMGFCLFMTPCSLLHSVLYARDKWLKSTGSIFPDQCILYIAAIEYRKIKDNKIDFWNNVD